MKQIRCLFVDFRHQLFAEIMQELLQSNDSVEVIQPANEITKFDDLVLSIKQFDVDVIIVEMDKNEIVERYENLLNIAAGAVLVCLIDDGRHALIFRNDIGHQDVVSLLANLGNKHGECI